MAGLDMSCASEVAGVIYEGRPNIINNLVIVTPWNWKSRHQSVSLYHTNENCNSR